ncbi:hypothetical protein EPR50_G00064460 [Perca flavescens]|uniref:EF-hand domain-containing protein n=2 Tax=Perca flavescens TaxID=8167 RepID=A0A484DB33_PERFV|nr:hypothetical protein EPR50_G00064460 [Perca flavescens]
MREFNISFLETNRERRSAVAEIVSCLLFSCPNDMESAIKTVVTTFLNSSSGKENLNGSGFQKLVKKKLGGLMQDADRASAVKEMQQGLDVNNDGKVSFQEYLTLIGYLANSLSESKTGTSANAS